MMEVLCSVGHVIALYRSLSHHAIKSWLELASTREVSIRPALLLTSEYPSLLSCHDRDRSHATARNEFC